MKTIIKSAALMLIYASTSFAQPSTSMVTHGNGSYGHKKESDKDFIYNAAMGGMMEVQLGKDAELQSNNQRVKNFGIMMHHDHSLANDRLKTIAKNKNIDFPDKLSTDIQMEVNKLNGIKGNEFDKNYMDMMVSDHKKDIKEFEDESAQATDPDVKTFATQTLVTLKMHLDSAQAISKSLK